MLMYLIPRRPSFSLSLRNPRVPRDLSNNGLKGTLPSAWGGLGLKLEKLWLASNKLQGTLPASFAKLLGSSPYVLLLGNPGLKGCVPRGFTASGYGSAPWNAQTGLTGFC
jgi:hypothetical protein